MVDWVGDGDGVGGGWSVWHGSFFLGSRVFFVFEFVGCLFCSFWDIVGVPGLMPSYDENPFRKGCQKGKSARCLFDTRI